MDLMIWLWLGAVVLFGVVEAATAGLVSIWFVAGAIVALAATLLGAPPTAQMVVFVAASALALAVTRPLVGKLTRPKAVPTNADRVLGLTARVTETINNTDSTGAVYADGKTWTARSADGAVIPTGTAVRVTDLEGVKLLVRPCEEYEEVVK